MNCNMKRGVDRVAQVLAIALVLAVVSVASAQKPVTQGAEVTETFTIGAIDYQGRLLTLKDKNGITEVLVAGPEIQRFNELKAGDTVTFRYYESVLYAVRPAGQPAPVTPGQPAVVRDKGPRPGGTLSEQLTTTVTVTAIDPKVPSLTVRTAEGRTLGFTIQDKKNIEGLKVGDKVDITYTRALAIRVESPK
jgi:hypothetical protein